MRKFSNFLFEYYWHAFFELGIFVKGFNGVLEIISGLLVFFISKTAFSNLFYFLARGELLEDSHDRFIDFVAFALQNFSTSSKTFAALYIFLHGMLNVFLAIQLYRNKLWAYLVTMGAMIVFLFYQVYRITQHHSVTLTIISIFDILFIILIWHEYRHQKSTAQQR